MSLKRIPFLFAALLLGVGGDLMASDRWETLQAINLVENPRNSPKPGANGELGPYQFLERTWRMHTSKPFSMAVQREHADEIAVLEHGSTPNKSAAATIHAIGKLLRVPIVLFVSVVVTTHKSDRGLPG